MFHAYEKTPRYRACSKLPTGSITKKGLATANGYKAFYKYGMKTGGVTMDCHGGGADQANTLNAFNLCPNKSRFQGLAT